VYSQETVGHEDEGGRGLRRARRMAYLTCLGNRIRRRIFGTAPCCESLDAIVTEFV
jgi:hypothetical protein